MLDATEQREQPLDQELGLARARRRLHEERARRVERVAPRDLVLASAVVVGRRVASFMRPLRSCPPSSASSARPRHSACRAHSARRRVARGDRRVAARELVGEPCISAASRAGHGQSTMPAPGSAGAGVPATSPPRPRDPPPSPPGLTCRSTTARTPAIRRAAPACRARAAWPRGGRRSSVPVTTPSRSCNRRSPRRRRRARRAGRDAARARGAEDEPLLVLDVDDRERRSRKLDRVEPCPEQAREAPGLERAHRRGTRRQRASSLSPVAARRPRARRAQAGLVGRATSAAWSRVSRQNAASAACTRMPRSIGVRPIAAAGQASARQASAPPPGTGTHSGLRSGPRLRWRSSGAGAGARSSTTARAPARVEHARAPRAPARPRSSPRRRTAPSCVAGPSSPFTAWLVITTVGAARRNPR